MSIENKAKEEAGKIGHTPGPWHAEDLNVESAAWSICRMDWDYEDDDIPKEQAEKNRDIDRANAHLIAASPDLYEACKQLLNLAHWAGIIESEAIDAGKAAISKAEGKV